ncbi:MAG TPA: Dabb family protein [Paludibacter sp.]|nr:Dabb family protein [Paludibacter sp.]
MIKHIVFFELAENAEGKTKAENAEIIRSGLENLVNLIPEIKKIEVGINVPNAPKTNFDIALYSEFEDMAALDRYQEHPEHLKIASYIGKVRISRAAVDYEA